MKGNFLRAISIGIHQELTESKRIAIQVGTLDGYWSFLAISIYFFMALLRESHALALLHLFSLSFIVISLWLFYLRRYDFARFLIHFTCMVEVFFTADAYPANSGIELFYFPMFLIPFVTFSSEEQWKGNILIVTAVILFVTQHLLGTGIFMEINSPDQFDNVTAIILVVSYLCFILGFMRWQVHESKKLVHKQQKELLEASRLNTLGEMSVSIAHEINNPLQSLSLQLVILREKFKDLQNIPDDMYRHLASMNNMVLRLGKLVQDFKQLARDTNAASRGNILFSKLLEEILVLSADKLKSRGIALYTEGDTNLKFLGQSGPVSQVLLGLIQNAIDTVSTAEEKWIRIEAIKIHGFLEIRIINSGSGEVECIPSWIHGIKEIIEENQGKIFCEDDESQTRYVLRLPSANVQ